MKTHRKEGPFKFIKRLMARLILSLCLYSTQVYNQNLVMAQEAGNPAPPQPTQNQPTSNNPLDQQVAAVQADILADAQENADDNEAHDNLADGKNLSYCKTLNDYTDEKYQAMEDYSTVHKNQLLDQIEQEGKKLDAEVAKLDNLSNAIREDAGNQVDQGTLQTGMEVGARREQLKGEIAAADNARKQLRQEHDTLLATYQELSRQCSVFCTKELRVKRDAAGAAWRAKRNEWQMKEQEYKDKYNEYYNAGKAFVGQQANITASGKDLNSSDAENEQGAWSQSGCQDWNPSTGECYGLSGPVYQQNEAFKNLVNRTTGEAAKFAQAKIERLAQLELQQTYSSDYRLYEMAFMKFDPSSRIAYNSTGFHGHDMAKSNLEVMSHAGAAAKHLRCVPISEAGTLISDYYNASNYANKYANDYNDSKSYHLFRAASAVYLMAQINDTAYYTDSSECRRFEDFSDDDKDTQVRSVERAANLYDQVFANMCLRVNPQDSALRARCDEHVAGMMGQDPKFVNMPRSRENALEMYKAAAAAAQAELDSKVRLTTTAHNNVEKGKRYVKLYTMRLAISIALKLMAGSLGDMFASQAAACCGASPACGACGGLVAMMKHWYAKFNEYWILQIYYVAMIIRWQQFTKKWQKKLEKARVHSHLACNEEAAKNETSHIKKFADQARADAMAEVQYAKDATLREISSKVAPKPDVPAEAPAPGGSTDPAPAPATTTYLNFDFRTGKKIQQAIAKSESIHQALMLASDMQRLKKGAVSSLPYDAKMPTQGEVNEFNDVIKKDISMGVVQGKFNTLVNVFFPEAHALVEALGVAYGSEAFHYFLIHRNRNWFLQAQDVTPYVNTRITTAPINLAPIESKSDYTGQPMQKSGFPVPETRVITTQNMVTILQENLTLMEMALTETAHQRDAYVLLLENMKKRFSLGVRGTENIIQLAPKLAKEHCAKQDVTGNFVGVDCGACKENPDSCGFSYPTFGEWSGDVAVAGNLAAETANHTLQGNSNAAQTSGNQLVDANQALSKFRRDIDKKMNDLRKKDGQAVVDVQKEAEKLREATHKAVFEEFARGSTILAVVERKNGNLRLTRNKNEKVDKEGIKKVKSKVEKRLAGSSKGKKKDSGKKGDEYDESGDKEEWEVGIPDFQDVKLDPALAAALKKGQEEDAAQASGDEDGLYGNSGHQRRGGEGNHKNWKGGIHTNWKQSLFKIISRRYERYAMPILAPKL